MLVSNIQPTVAFLILIIWITSHSSQFSLTCYTGMLMIQIVSLSYVVVEINSS